ncbi:MAG: serine hydrolase [Bacteroidota bacterium]
MRKLIPYIIILLLAACQQPESPAPARVYVPFLKEKSSWADSLLQRMTLEEKIGQLIVLESSWTDSVVQADFLDWVRNGQLGGYLLDSLPLEQYLNLADTAQQYASIPLLAGTNQKVSLLNHFSDLPHLPAPASLAAIPNDSLHQQLTRSFIGHSKSLGINFSFSPSIETTYQSKGYNYDSFGEDKGLILRQADELMDQLQEEKILSFAEYFNDYSGTPADTSLVQQNRLLPYAQLVQDGLSGLVIGEAALQVDSIERRPIGFLQNYLEQYINFAGLLIGKWQDEINFDHLFRAGADLFVVKDSLPQATARLMAFHESGLLSDAMLDAKVIKVLMAKSWSGLDTLPPAIDPTWASQQLEHKQHEVFAKSLYEQSVVLVNNHNSRLPFTTVNRRNFRIFHYGREHLRRFKSMFYKHAGYTSQLLPPDALTGEFKDLPSKKLRASTLVLTIDQLHIDPQRDSVFLNRINGLSKKHPTVIVNFGNPYNLQYFDREVTTVQLFERNEITEDIAAQLLFGGLSANGQLPVHVADHLPSGTSNATPIIRLKYTSPEEVGIAPEKLVGIDAFVKGAIASGAIPGCQVLVAKEGKVIYNKAFGYHTYKKRQPVSTSDLYDIASITKVASTTLAGMRLYEQGKYDLNGRLKDYLDLPAKSRIKNEKIRYLLAHRSRLQANMPVGKYIRYQDTTRQRLQNKYFSRWRSEPYTIQVADSMYFSTAQLDTFWMDIGNLRPRKRRRYRYSDVNFNLLQRVFEKTSGRRLNRYVHDNFYAPLNLRRLLYNPRSKFNPKHLVPTEDDARFRKQLLRGFVHDESAALLGGVAGNAGLFSNAEDLAVLFQMLLNRGSYGGFQYFKPSTIDYFVSSQHGNHRGLGFDRPRNSRLPSCARSASKKTYGHTGFTGSCAWVDPKNELVFIFLSNRRNP